jgi:hypothetical protein
MVSDELRRGRSKVRFRALHGPLGDPISSSCDTIILPLATQRADEEGALSRRRGRRRLRSGLGPRSFFSSEVVM